MSYYKLLALWGFGCLTAFAGLADVNEDFNARRNTMHDKEIFAPFNDKSLQGDRLEAMKFLYAYMPLPDITGYDADFHIKNVDVALRAKKEMPWGKSVPEREWKHFVLPVRVNNESLDNSREVFYEELRDRVKDMSMKDAILEVNHWCHEKVTYRPSDARTSNPLSTVSQAIGRCGEESTFTVAALRAVGIPARQVYTPRWAHTDDNHAWVEAWADGEWYFLGACEPAPILDMAWFNAPAARGMLMTTNVFGKYDGPEEQLEALPLVTTINVTSKYAPVDKLIVKVLDTDGNPVKDAKVNFSLYNYAEFYPVATKHTDNDGKASLTAGIGDVMVWASNGNKFGMAKGRPGEQTLTVVLDKDNSYSGTFDLTFVPPVPSGNLPTPSQEAIDINNRRLQYEDSIRNAYMETFASLEDAVRVADSIGVDKERLKNIIAETRGNGHTILNYISHLPAEKREIALLVLESVTEKDRRDIPMEVIDDNIYHTIGNSNLPHYNKYVLSPRIDTEALTPFKSYLSKKAGKKILQSFSEDPYQLINWVRDNIEIVNDENPKLTRMDPRAVWRERRADPRSRDIFYVAMARTAGITARIDPVTGKTQFIPNGSNDWQDVVLSNTRNTSALSSTGNLDMPYSKVGRMDNPKYYYQFSISKINDGTPKQLEYDETASWSELQATKTPLDAGQYLLLSGQRMADGSVLTHGEIFNISDNQITTVPLIIREDPTGVQVIGNLNAENIYYDTNENCDRSILSKTGRGYYVLGIIKPSDEPSAHALNDLSALKSELEDLNIPIIVMFTDKDAEKRFDYSNFQNLPNTLSFGIDSNGSSLNELVATINLSDSSLPLFVVADSFNRVVFVSQGYTIGLGDKIADVLSKVK